TSAKLEDGLLDLLPGTRGDLTAGVLAAGERRRRDAIVVEERGNRLRANEQRLKDAVRRACFAEELLERERALRHVRRVLEQPNVARAQSRRGEADDLPEGKVPRHDR